MSEKTFRVAIVGGGVCGLTCAIALLREGVDVHVYEAAVQFGEIGAGIGLGLNAIRILIALGVYGDILARVHETNATEPMDVPDQHLGRNDVDHMDVWFKFVSGMPGHEVVCDYGAEEKVTVGMHRATFLDALVRHIDPARAHFHKRCMHLTHTTDGVTIHFQDGTTATADIVLGADGIKSAVRRFVADTEGAEVDPNLKFSRTGCYRVSIPATKAAATGLQTNFQLRPICFTGDKKHLIIYTVKAGTIINVSAFHTDADSDPAHYPPPLKETAQQVAVETVLAAYDGWGPEVRSLLGCAENLTKWSLDVVHPPISPEKWVRGRVAILGDAAHGMLPHLGAGAGQGIEDAYLLGKLLGHPQTTLANVESVLKAYSAVRQPRAQKVWEDSRRAGDLYDGRADANGLFLEEVKAMAAHVWNYPQDKGFNDAVALLTEKGAFAKASS